MRSQRMRVVSLCALVAVGAAAQSTYSNGPIITHPGMGLGGADVSALETAGTNIGATVGPTNFRLADDFTVPCGEVWTVSSFRVYGYQTGSGTTSTLTSADYRIWIGRPGSPGAVILHDFSATNQLTTTGWTNIYRVSGALPAALSGNTRPVFFADMNPNGISLPAGTYWLDFRMAGSLASGPFTPPISGLASAPPTGNAVQLTVGTAGPLWSTGIISGPSLVGMPFEIDYVNTPTNCYTYTITQTTPGGTITIANAGGLPGHIYLNPITFNQGTFPNGWLSGVDIPIGELFNEVSLGAPFFGFLDGLGSATFVVPAGILPPGLTIYTASNYYLGFGALGGVPAFSFTTI